MSSAGMMAWMNEIKEKLAAMIYGGKLDAKTG